MLWYRLWSLIKYISLYNTSLLFFAASLPFCLSSSVVEMFWKDFFFSFFCKSVREMQPAIILLVFINDCKAFAYLQSPVLSPIQNNCVKETKKKKEKKAILFLLWCPRDKCFFICLLYHLNVAVLSLVIRDWKPAVGFPSPFCSTTRNHKGYGFLTKYRTTWDMWIEWS